MKKLTPFGEIEIIDGHSHFFSRKYFEVLIGQSGNLSRLEDPISRVAEMTGWRMPPGDPVEFAGEWVEELDRHRVSAAVMMASVPPDETSIAAAVKACPERIIGALMFDPTKPDAEARARRAFDDLNIRVLCLFPAMHLYSVAESEAVRAIAALAAERKGKAIFIHCGVLSIGARKKLGLPSHFDMRFSNPLDICRLACEFPETGFIIPHFGAGMFREALMLADMCSNVYLDTSSSNAWIKYDASPVDLTAIFRRALDVAGPQRLIFGTDSSFFPRGWNSQVFDAQVKILGDIGISNDQAVDIFSGNLKRLLSLT